jgi:hypothetical protein
MINEYDNNTIIIDSGDQNQISLPIGTFQSNSMSSLIESGGNDTKKAEITTTSPGSFALPGSSSFEGPESYDLATGLSSSSTPLRLNTERSGTGPSTTTLFHKLKNSDLLTIEGYVCGVTDSMHIYQDPSLS